MFIGVGETTETQCGSAAFRRAERSKAFILLIIFDRSAHAVGHKGTGKARSAGSSFGSNRAIRASNRARGIGLKQAIRGRGRRRPRPSYDASGAGRVVQAISSAKLRA